MPKSPTIPWFKAYKLMATAKSMAELYEREKDTTSKYVHAAAADTKLHSWLWPAARAKELRCRTTETIVFCWVLG